MGKRLRERKKGYAKKYEKQNGTPIFPYDHEYQLTGKKTKYGQTLTISPEAQLCPDLTQNSGRTEESKATQL